MIMVITWTRGDEAAERFVAFAQARGVPAQSVTAWQEVQLTVTTTREGSVAVDLGIAGEQVSAIVNRMPPVPRDASAEERFRVSEGLATLWVALAMFQGPVVNRPDARGYLPSIHLPARGAEVFGLQWVASTVSTRPPDAADGVVASVEQLTTGVYRSIQIHGGADGAVRRYTSAERIGRVLVAGRQAFALDDMAGCEYPHVLPATPLFSVLTLALSGSRAGLICADPIPRWADYAPLADRVHTALLDALAS